MSTQPIKYRSEYRDQPRIVGGGGGSNKPRPKGGLVYHYSGPALSEMLEEARVHNRAELPKKFGLQTDSIIKSLDALHAIASQYAWTFKSVLGPVLNPAHDVLFACFHKSLLNIHAALQLTLDGLYGIARPHLRQCFESLMIAKYCSCDPESEIFDRWIDGVDLYFTKGILKKIQTPDIDPFQEIWTILSRWSHATVFASQMTTDFETTSDETLINLALISGLIEFLEHILISHILTPSIKYYGARYSTEEIDPAIELKQQLKEHIRQLRAIEGTATKTLVRAYRSRWQIR